VKCKHEDEYRIILFDHTPTLDSSQVSELQKVGVRTLQTCLCWNKAEPEKGVYDWDTVDRYIDTARQAGMRVLLRLPMGAPRWAPEEWFFRSSSDTNAHSPWENRHFSLWNEEATKYTEEFIWKACQRYSGDDIVCCPCIGSWWGETWFPVHMGDGYYAARGHRRGFWHRDASALQDFRYRMKRKYHKLKDFNTANNTSFPSWDLVEPADFCDDRLRWADTIEWYNSSAERHHRRIQDLFITATGNTEAWMATVLCYAFQIHYIDAGMFRAEEWIDRMRRSIMRRGIEFNMFLFSIFQAHPDIQAFFLWVIRHYGWNTWVGADDLLPEICAT